MRRLQALKFDFVRGLALDYVARRETTQSKLRSYLNRKFENAKEPKVQEWFEKIILECVDKKYIEHARFMESWTREYQRRRKGPRYIAQKLQEKGLTKSEIEIPENEAFETSLRELLERWAKSTPFQKLTTIHEKKAYLTRKALSQGYEYGKMKSQIEDILKQID